MMSLLRCAASRLTRKERNVSKVELLRQSGYSESEPIPEQDIEAYTFNMAFSLNGETVPNAGTPKTANCKGKTISALSEQFGTIDDAVSVLGFSSVTALQDGINLFCGL